MALLGRLAVGHCNTLRAAVAPAARCFSTAPVVSTASKGFMAAPRLRAAFAPAVAAGRVRFASVAQIKELRALTSAPMGDCKKALTAEGVDGDMQKAIDWLRKNGVNMATKKAGRSAAEGAVCVATSDDGTAAVVVEVNTETDFVGRNADFTAFVKRVADAALATTTTTNSAADNLAALNAATLVGGGADGADISVAEGVTDVVATFRENVVLRRVERQQLDGPGVLATYTHNAFGVKGVGGIGAVVAMTSDRELSAEESEKVAGLGQTLAMHVVAATPLAVTPEGVDQEALERERQILTQQAQASGKPDNIIEKMVTGRMHKFYKENVLLEQPCFVGEDDSPVKKVVAKMGKEIGATLGVSGFSRFKVGEGVDSVDEE